MNINKTLNGGKLIINLDGRLDTTTAPDLDQEVKNSLNDVTELIFNLANLEYISSAGLRVLMAAQKAMTGKGSMKIINANDMVREVFDVTGLADVFTIE